MVEYIQERQILEYLGTAQRRILPFLETTIAIAHARHGKHKVSIVYPEREGLMRA